MPVAAVIALHCFATRYFVSAPLALLLYGSTALSALVALFGWRARYSLEISRRVVSFILIVVLFLGLATSFLALSDLSHEQIKIVVCVMPLIWSVIWSLYYLCGDAPRESFLKLIASLSAGYIGVSLVFVIWYIGGMTAAVNRPAGERFPHTFTLWDTLEISKHMFMLFDTRWSQYENKLCYHGYSPLFTVSHYVVLKFIRWYSGLSYDRGIRLSAFGYAIVISFVIPLCTSLRLHFQRASKVGFLVWLYVPIILVVSIPDIWTGPLRMDGDNCFPLFALGVYAIACLVGRALERGESSIWICTFLAAAFLSALIPILFVPVAMTLCIMFVGFQRRELLVTGVIILSASIGTYLVMGILAKSAGLTLQGSSLLVRTGFNTGGLGSLQSAWMALAYPTDQNTLRPYSFMWVALYIAVAAFIANCFIAVSKPSSNLIFVLLAPLALDLVIFSQSHTIHPYLYDIPVSILGALSLYWVASSDEGDERAAVRQLRPWVALVFICGSVGNFMSLRTFLFH